MLRSAKELIGYNVRALDDLDENVGHVSDFYFDDRSWVIRYLVVDTGGWLSGREVLVSPLTMAQPDWARKMLPINLTKEQIENSPSIDLEKPVSRQHETKLREYYGWPPYWGAVARPMTPRPMSIYFAPSVFTPANSADKPNGQNSVRRYTPQDSEYEDVRQYSPHLRSMDEVIGYNIQARDGEIGHVETFIIDDENWSIMYLVVDTRNWLPGKNVLVALDWVEQVDWLEQLVHIDLERETIKDGPEYDPTEPVNRELEMTLYDYHGRPVYW